MARNQNCQIWKVIEIIKENATESILSSNTRVRFGRCSQLNYLDKQKYAFFFVADQRRNKQQGVGYERKCITPPFSLQTGKISPFETRASQSPLQAGGPLCPISTFTPPSLPNVWNWYDIMGMVQLVGQMDGLSYLYLDFCFDYISQAR